MKNSLFVLLTLLGLISSCASTPPSPSTVDTKSACSLGSDAAKASNHTLAIEYLNVCLTRAMPLEQTVNVFRLRGRSYFELKDYEMALKDEEHALQLRKPVDQWPFISLAVYQRALRQYDKSLASLSDAVKVEESSRGRAPGMPVYFHTGWTLHEAGRFEEAIVAYSAGIPKQPDFGGVFYRRALSYEALGDKELARKDLLRAFELTPEKGWEPKVSEKLAEYGFVKKN